MNAVTGMHTGPMQMSGICELNANFRARHEEEGEDEDEEGEDDDEEEDDRGGGEALSVRKK